MNFMENIPEIGTANRRGAVTVRKSASIKVVACMMAWSMITAWGLSQGGEFHAAAVLNEQPEPHHRETTRAYNIFEAVGVAEARAKDVRKVQQSDLLPDAGLADVKIAEQVKAVVRRDPDVRTVDVVIYVSRGVVTLTGIVSTPDQKSRAEQLASEVEGVTAVVNHIAVSDVRP
jgi:hypothetical protein